MLEKLRLHRKRVRELWTILRTKFFLKHAKEHSKIK